MKLSHHSIIRMDERTNIDRNNQKSFFKNALVKGKSAGELKDGSIKSFLIKKEKYNCKVKLYKGFIFIYSRNNKQLYTMYKLPDELLKNEGEQV